MSELRNRCIVFVQRPNGVPGDDCWKLVENEPVREPVEHGIERYPATLYPPPCIDPKGIPS